MIKTRQFSPDSIKNNQSGLISQYQSEEMILDLQNLKNKMKNTIKNKNSHLGNNSNQNSKINISMKRPLSDRNNIMSSIKDHQTIDYSNDNEGHIKTDRQTLLQKKKSYAETIREKNKIQLQARSKRKDFNDGRTESAKNLFFETPIKSLNNQNSSYGFGQAYYSNKKCSFSNRTSVFEQITQGSNRSNIRPQYSQSQTSLKKNKSLMKCCVNKTIDLISSASKYQNKQNNKFYLAPSSAKSIKNFTNQDQIQKVDSSYSQIFQKKSMMNALINHQANTNPSKRILSNSKKSYQKKIMQSMMMESVHQFDEEKEINEFEEQKSIEQLSFIGFGNNKNLSQQTKSSTLSLQSQTISLAVTSHLDQYQRLRIQEQKQIIVLRKQNGTFKKDLTNIRKQNSTLKKELEHCKRHMKQLEEQSKQLIQIQNKQKLILEQKINLPKQNIQQILISSQQQIFSLKSENKALQLKLYMIEKRMIQQQQMSKKRTAVQVNSWKQKYNKLRNEHLKTKSNPFFQSDWSIEMEISQEQD